MEASARDGAALNAFFQYAQRRSLVMVSTGLVAVSAGVAVAMVAGGGATTLTTVLLIVGVGLIVGSVTGLRCLREARGVVTGSAQLMELRSWPYRSIRAPANNRVLVTLDHPGSINRTPLAEFKARWFTPGAGESAERASRVYGSLSRGHTVLAVADDGSCFAGRVTRIRD